MPYNGATNNRALGAHGVRAGLGDMIESPAHLKDTPTKDKVRRIWLCRKDPQGIEITDVA